VLDAGCGEGRHTFECFRRDCSILGMDLDHRSLLKARYVLEQLRGRPDAAGRFSLLRGTPCDSLSGMRPLTKSSVPR